MLNIAILDSYIPTDIRVDVLILACIFLFAGLFEVQIKDWTLNGSWIVRTGSLLCGAFLLYLVVSGKSLIPQNQSPQSVVADSTAAGDPCAAAGSQDNPQCYLDFGHAWNNIHKYDQAIAFFTRGEAAASRLDQSVWWKTRAYNFREWGYALLGEGKCAEAAKEFQSAKKIFEAHKEDDGGGSQQGITMAQKCEH